MNRFQIAGRQIGPGFPVYVIAELSANHAHKFEKAVELIHAAKEAGADAIKVQTYTADTITHRSDKEPFRIKGGTIWDGRTLHDLYAEAYTPWEWQPELQKIANQSGLALFSSAFDDTAVEFLERMDVPAHKVASPELVDLPLIRKMASTGKPLIISTGMGTVEEIDEAVRTAREAGATQIALLKCTSAYPALPSEMNLKTISAMIDRYQVPVGLSDHSLGIAVPVTAVALGANIVEKHLTLSRGDGGPDSAFSLEPPEFKAMVDGVRTAEVAIGSVHYGADEYERATLAYRRSLFVVAPIRKGERFTTQNVRSIRPANGLHTRHLDEIVGREAVCDIEAGTPLSWELIEASEAAQRGW